MMILMMVTIMIIGYRSMWNQGQVENEQITLFARGAIAKKFDNNIEILTSQVMYAEGNNPGPFAVINL